MDVSSSGEAAGATGRHCGAWPRRHDGPDRGAVRPHRWRIRAQDPAALAAALAGRPGVGEVADVPGGAEVGPLTEDEAADLLAALVARDVRVVGFAPALSAQTVNGDRERGTLAALQVTRLTAGDIAVGKLAASWGTSLVVLLLTMSSVLWPVKEGAVGPGRAAVVIAVMVLLIGIVCAISQGWSALVARSITSVLLSYLTVFALLVGTPLLYALALPLTEDVDGGERSDQVWWLLAPNPVVVLADAAPRLPERTVVYRGYVFRDESQPDDVLGSLGHEIRRARTGDRMAVHHGHPRYYEGGPVWTYGLAFDLALAGGALWISARRLRTPMYRVPRAVRVA